MERNVSGAIARHVELWKQTAICYQKVVLNGDAENILGLENGFVYMAMEAVLSVWFIFIVYGCAFGGSRFYPMHGN